MRRYCPSDRHGGSRFRGFALAFTSLASELASDITSFLTVDCFSNVLKTGCHKCACSMECSRNQVKGGLSCHADLASSPGPFPAFQCFTLKNGRAWYTSAREVEQW